MEDDYKVGVTLVLYQDGHGDPDFPDKHCSITFDATDAHVSVVLEQFQDFLVLMGYNMDTKRLELVDKDQKRDRNTAIKAYQDCIEIIDKLKDNPFTAMGSHHYTNAAEWMRAFGDDVKVQIINKMKKI